MQGPTIKFDPVAYREGFPFEKWFVRARFYWEPTPKWHWRYWIGHTMRQRDTRVVGGIRPVWGYRTYRQHARAILEEKYGRS